MTSAKTRSRAHWGDPLEYHFRGVTKLYSLWLSYTYPFARVGHNISVQYPCIISKKFSPRMSIGSNVIVRKDTWLNIVEDERDEVKLVIGDNCVLGGRDTISAKNMIHIERDVMMATSVLIQDHHHAYEDIHMSIRNQGTTPGGRIRIEEGCWIGKGAAIICNEGELVIGRNSVIGANALVTRSCAPGSVLVGNPARLARQFDPAKEVWVGGEAGRVASAGTTR
jgi:acetyltransferase-like isoleucine patch superfamily enzyme